MALSSEATTQAAWKDLTPLARNEWICWVISAKQETTRSRRIQRAIEELQGGQTPPLLLARLSAPPTQREEVVRETSTLTPSTTSAAALHPL